MANGGNINFNVGFSTNTAGLEKARKALQDLQNMSHEELSLNMEGSSQKVMRQINDAKQAARELEGILNKSYNNKLGGLDVSSFVKNCNEGGNALNKIYARMSKVGEVGKKAFRDVAIETLSMTNEFKKTQTTLDKMATTMGNTIKWGITSSIWKNFTTSIQGAYQYVLNLDKSLNDIRIVTGQSAEQMDKFAKVANKAAQELGASTTSYTKASLIYYQQGLDDKAVKERTDATIKMSNVLGESAKEVSSYMTAIWNNFDDGSQSLEHYGDVITNLGAHTASSAAEIAEGLEKFAAVADTVGLSYEYATASLATVVAETRQSADVVGTAFKTLFARMEGLKLGDTLEDGTDLNKYSKALEAVGVSIKDQNGELKAMDTILDEMGAKWQTLSKDQQVALAQTVAGTRQYSQMIALMDNWDKVQNNIAIANSSDGTLERQQLIYMDSAEAHLQQLKTAWEDMYDSLLNADAIKSVTDGLTTVVKLATNFVDALGGGKGVLLTIGSLMTNIFSKKIGTAIGTAINNIKGEFQNGESIATKNLKNNLNGIIEASTNPNLAPGQQDEILNDITGKYQEILDLKVDLSNEEIKYLGSLAKERAEILSNNKALEEENKLKQNQADMLGIGDSRGYNSQLTNEDRNKIASRFKVIKDYPEIKASFQTYDLDDENQNEKFKELFVNRGDANIFSIETRKLISEFINDEKGEFQEAIDTIESLTDKIDNLDDSQKRELENAVKVYLNKQQEGSNNATESARKDFAKAASGGYKPDKDSLDRNDDEYRNLKGLKNTEKIVTTTTQAMSAVMALGQAITTVDTITQTWQDDSLSVTEKITQSFMSIGGAAMSAIPAINALSKSIEVGFGPLTAIFASVIAVVEGLKLLANHFGDSESKMKANADAAQALSEELNNVKQESENIKQEFEKYNSAADALNKCAKYSHQWKEALIEVNQQVLDLIGKYPELINYVQKTADGQLTIDTDKYLEFEANKVASTQAASFIANQRVREDNIKKQQNDILNNTLENYFSSPLVTKSMNKIGIEEIYSTDGAERLRQALENVVIDPNQDLQGQLENALKEYGFATDTEKLAASLSQNVDAINKLQESVEKNTYATDLENQQIVSQMLSDNGEVQNSEFKTSIEKALGRGYDSLIEEQKKAWKDITWSSDYNENSNGGKQLTELWDKYAEIQGLGNVGLASNSIKRINGIDYVQTLDGQTINLEDIKNTVAASNLMNGELDKAANDLMKTFEELSSSGDSVKQTLAQIIVGGGDYDNVSKENLDELKATIINRPQDEDKREEIFEQIEDKYNSYGGDTQDTRYKQLKDKDGRTYDKREDYLNDAANAVTNMMEASGKSAEELMQIYNAKNIEDLGYKIIDSIVGSEAWNEAGDNIVNPLLEDIWNGFEESSNAQKLGIIQKTQMSQIMQDAFIAGGKDGAQLIKDIFDKVDPKDANDFAEVISNIDWQTERPEELAKTLQMAGVDTSNFDNDLLSLCDAMRNAGFVAEGLEENYKSLHSVVDKLNKFDILEDKDYQTIYGAIGSAAENYFQTMADGTHQLVGDAKELYNLVNTQSRAGLRQSIDTVTKINYSLDDLQTNDNSRDVTIGGPKTSRTIEVDVFNSKEKVQAQLDLLRAAGFEAEKIAEWQAQLDENGKLNSSADYKEVTEAVKNETLAFSDLSEMTEKYRQELASTASGLRELDGMLVTGEISTIAYNKALDSITKKETDSYGLDYDTVIAQSTELAEKYDLTASEARKMAIETQRTEQAIASLSKDLPTLKKNLQNTDKTSSAYAKSVAALSKGVAGLVGANEDLILSGEFLEENLGLIEKAVKGDTDAINELGLAVAKESVEDIKNPFDNVGLDYALFEKSRQIVLQGIQSIQDALGSLETGQSLTEVLGGDEATQKWVRSLNEMALQTKMSVEQMNGYLSSMGIETEVVTTPVRQQTKIPVYETTETVTPDPDNSSDPTAPSTHTIRSETRVVDHKTVWETIEVAQINAGKNGKGPSLKYSGAQTPSGGSSGGSSGGGKGSGKKTAKKTPNKDRYYKVNTSLSNISNEYNKISKAQSALIGNGYTDNLIQQNSLLSKQINNLKYKAKLQKQESKELKNNKLDGKNLTGLNGKKYLKSGIFDYNKFEKDLANTYNSKIAAAEKKYSGDALEDQKEKIDKWYDNWKSWEERVKNLNSESADVQSQLQEAANNMIENATTALNYKIRFDIDATNLKQEYNTWFNEFKAGLKKDIPKVQAEIAKAQVDTLYNTADGGQLNSLRKKLNNLVARDKKFDKNPNYIDPQYGKDRAKLREDIKEISQELQNESSQFYEFLASANQALLDSYDNIEDKLSNIEKQYDNINNSIDHAISLTKLLYGEASYSVLDKYYNQSVSNAAEQVQQALVRSQLWTNELANAKKEDEEAYEAVLENYNNAQNNTREKLVNYIEKANEQFANTVEIEIQKFLSEFGEKELDGLKEEWELATKAADQFLDKVNAAYETSKLESKYLEAIDKNNGDVKIQRQITAAMNAQIDLLRQKEKLSQFDIDLANKRYEILLKEIALQDAQANKTKMRLKRDSQGNYSYVYAENEEDKRKAEDELNQARQDEWNLIKNNWLSEYQNFETNLNDFLQKVREVSSKNLSEDQQKQELKNLREYYAPILSNSKILTGTPKDEVINYLEEYTGQNLSGMTDEERDKVIKQYLPQWDSRLADFTNSMLTTDNINDLLKNSVTDPISTSYSTMQDNISTILETAGVTRDALLEGAVFDDYKNTVTTALEPLNEYFEDEKENSKSIGEIKESLKLIQQEFEKDGGLKEQIKTSVTAANRQLTTSFESIKIPNYHNDLSAIYRALTGEDLVVVNSGSGTFASGASGMYTGDWTGNDGKIAILHKKELVLNQNDTKNILDAINLLNTNKLDTILNQIGYGANKMLGSKIMGTENIQNVTIQAQFPNATQSEEIEKALNDLVNQASQYAFRTY